MRKLTNSKRTVAMRSRRRPAARVTNVDHARVHLVHRTETHITDTLAVRKVIAGLSANWVIRDITERDYGIDMMVEYFAGHAPTGRIAFFQIKGTSQKIEIRDGRIAFPLKKKTLGYAECFTVPFFLMHCDINDPEGNVYYLWLQKYIMTTLHEQNPTWRNAEQDHFTVYIPAQNRLPATEQRMLEFCRHPQRVTESLQFLGHLYQWKVHYGGLTNGFMKAAGPCVKLLQQMSELKAALSGDDAHLSSEDLIAGIRALEGLMTKGYRAAVEEYHYLVELNGDLEKFETGVLWTNFDLWKFQETGDYPY